MGKTKKVDSSDSVGGGNLFINHFNYFHYRQLFG